jgi:hypothetical protein
MENVYRILKPTLDDIADAIRAKDGSSAPILTENMADAIAAIPSGGGDAMPLSGNVAFMPYGVDVSGNVTLDFPNSNLALGRCFQNAKKTSGTGEIKLTIKCKSITSLNFSTGRLNYFMYNSSAFDAVDFQCSEMDYIDTDISSFSQCSSIKSISGTPFSLAGTFSISTAVYRPFVNCNNLVDVRFYENKSAQTVYFLFAPSLSDASLVSLSNGLQVSEGAAVLNLHATPKAKLSSIYGYTESVTRGTETYDRFVADASGSVSLMDFITNTKGWTVA